MTPLALRELSRLRFDDGQPLAAASGLVCTAGRVFVVGDDALHLGVFEHAQQPGWKHQLLPGHLPREAKARKQAKPDFEVLLRWGGGLLVLGSGSKAPQRNRAVWLPLGADGRPGAPNAFSLAPLYEPLRKELGGLNIEGAMQQGERLLLLQRGNAGHVGNALVSLPSASMDALRQGRESRLTDLRVTPMALGHLDGVPLGLTDACALADGHWLFSAAAEATDDAINDGAVAGSVIGLADATGEVLKQWRLPGRLKVEGLDARPWPNGRISLAMVTDADDPAQPAQLLGARL